MLGVLDRVLGDHATSYQLHLTQVIDIGPGEPAQMMHRDQWAFDFFPFPAGFEVECHTMWAITDFTEENGATRVIPGSNRWDDKLRPEPDETVAGRDAEGLGAALRRLAVPRRRREHVGRVAARHQRRLHAVVVAAGGEPVPRVPARGRARRCPSSSPASSATERGAYALGYFGDLRDPIEALHGYADAPPQFAAAPPSPPTAPPGRGA